MRTPDRTFTVEEILESGESIETEPDKWGTSQRFLMTVDGVNYITSWLDFHHYEGCQSDNNDKINAWTAHQVMVPKWEIIKDEVQNIA